MQWDLHRLKNSCCQAVNYSSEFIKVQFVQIESPEPTEHLLLHIFLEYLRTFIYFNKLPGLLKQERLHVAHLGSSPVEHTVLLCLPEHHFVIMGWFWPAQLQYVGVGSSRVRGFDGSGDRTAAPVTQKQTNGRKACYAFIVATTSLSSAVASVSRG